VDSAAQLLEECAARPDDDAPRLAWADLVGGERGELVVLQCDLARGGLAPAEVARRRRRERELLAAHGVAWAGDLTHAASRWSFRRGFVEAARVTRNAGDAPFAEHPLLASLQLAPWSQAAGRVGRVAMLVPRLHALDLDDDAGAADAPDHASRLQALASSPALRDLRAFGIAHLDGRGVAAVRTLVAAAPLARLRLRDHRLDEADVAKLLETAPRLAALELAPAREHPNPLAPVADRPLRALALGDTAPGELARLARGRIAGTLERLAFDCAPHDAPEVELPGLSALGALRVLELGGGDLDSAIRALCLCELPALRVLRLRRAVSPRGLAALVARFGAQLELLDVVPPPPLPGPASAPAIAPALHARVAGELHADALEAFVGRAERELLHASPDAMLALGRACFEATPPASFTRTDHASSTVWTVPPLPSDARIELGRGSQHAIRLPSGTVARTHASLQWFVDAYYIVDRGSTNGIRVNGNAVASMTRLADGDELKLGEVTLRYRILTSARWPA